MKYENGRYFYIYNFSWFFLKFLEIPKFFQILLSFLQYKLNDHSKTNLKTTIMKKLVFLLVCLFTLQTVVRADNTKPIQVTQMPQSAQQLIKQHFSDSKVALAKMENDSFYKSYEVIFTNGNKVEFDKKGNWTEIDCKQTVVPTATIPTAIQKYVTTNYPNVKVLKIERDKQEYEVKLSNRVELKFDLRFNLIDIDN